MAEQAFVEERLLVASAGAFHLVAEPPQNLIVEANSDARLSARRSDHRPVFLRENHIHVSCVSTRIMPRIPRGFNVGPGFSLAVFDFRRSKGAVGQQSAKIPQKTGPGPAVRRPTGV